MTEITPHPDRNIVLTGFMGAGKTAVGRYLAGHLDRRFVDMDDLLIERFGKSIPEVFAEEGETAFRTMEAQLCQELAGQQGLVVSTGGGALVNDKSRSTMVSTGTVICLYASEDAIVRRLAADGNRPLLQGSVEERREKIRLLLRQRRAAYGAIPYQIDTTELSIEQVADRVLAAIRADLEAPGMICLPVKSPDGAYDLLLGSGLLAQAGALLARRGMRPGRVAIVTNVMIQEHADSLAEGLTAAGFDPILCLVPEGEQYKTLDTVRTLYEQFLTAHLDRNSAVIALGGGVIGDMAGFAAATYLRGVPFVQMPTSLLAMVDASVGGKTGVDMPQGKNLVGAFKQPKVVVMDTDTFSTLPPDEFQSGLAEVVKHGIIGAPRLFTQLETEGPANLKQLVADAVQVKIDIVETDPYERGERAFLNLGHTFGHAIELVSNFGMRHGEAVAVGLVAAARLSAGLGQASPAFADRVEDLLNHLGLPTSVAGYAIEDVRLAMLHDKKRTGGTLRFIIPRDLGDVTIIDDPGETAVQEALQSVVL